MTPDAFFEVRFKTPEEGGRKTSIVGSFYACPLFIEGEKEGFDCRLLLGGKTLELGQSYCVPVKFMNRNLVFSKLKVGANMTFWEGKNIGLGKVLKLF